MDKRDIKTLSFLLSLKALLLIHCWNSPLSGCHLLSRTCRAASPHNAQNSRECDDADCRGQTCDEVQWVMLPGLNGPVLTWWAEACDRYPGNHYIHQGWSPPPGRLYRTSFSTPSHSEISKSNKPTTKTQDCMRSGWTRPSKGPPESHSCWLLAHKANNPTIVYNDLNNIKTVLLFLSVLLVAFLGCLLQLE